MKCRLLRDEQGEPKTPAEKAAFAKSGILPTIPAGTVIEGPHAPLFVRMGMAEPADDECRLKAGMTPEEMTAAQHAQERVRRGIVPEDFPAFDAGLMTGYDADGNWIPGPNYVEPDDEEFDDEELEEEEDE